MQRKISSSGFDFFFFFLTMIVSHVNHRMLVARLVSRRYQGEETKDSYRFALYFDEDLACAQRARDLEGEISALTAI